MQDVTCTRRGAQHTARGAKHTVQEARSTRCLCSTATNGSTKRRGCTDAENMLYRTWSSPEVVAAPMEKEDEDGGREEGRMTTARRRRRRSRRQRGRGGGGGAAPSGTAQLWILMIESWAYTAAEGLWLICRSLPAQGAKATEVTKRFD
ncbi:unnamed protein product [Prorocentrum cordatum]|uniref:Uncharacterized protein n=1 Tax=Prorocentrum cordatum TaxID=2364126 RepID=A0ABN9VXS0_9DINO|nr:unnamed protein product [Polarella glacialis]